MPSVMRTRQRASHPLFTRNPHGLLKTARADMEELPARPGRAHVEAATHLAGDLRCWRRPIACPCWTPVTLLPHDDSYGNSLQHAIFSLPNLALRAIRQTTMPAR